MTLVMETRQEWGAAPPRNRRFDVQPSLGGVAVHYPGIFGSLRNQGHEVCRRFLRTWQIQHKNKGSNDLEYGSLICPHHIWMEGRTEFRIENGINYWRVRVGSNGTRWANTTHTSIQFMLGTLDKFTDEDKAVLAEAIAILRENGGWGDAVDPHSKFVGTACPGVFIRSALPEVKRMADRWKEFEVPLTDEEIERIVEGTAARVNRVLGDYNATGKPVGPNADDPEYGSTKLRQIEKVVRRIEEHLTGVTPEPEQPEIDCDYEVQKGDTFWSLSEAWGVTVDDIQDANPGIDPTKLEVGDCLNRP